MFTVCIFTMCVALSLAKRCVALCEFVALVFGQTPFVCDRTAERETKTCCENGSNDCEHVDLRFSHKNYSEFCRFCEMQLARNAASEHTKGKIATIKIGWKFPSHQHRQHWALSTVINLLFFGAAAIPSLSSFIFYANSFLLFARSHKSPSPASKSSSV